jgi:hypothetical protein
VAIRRRLRHQMRLPTWDIARTAAVPVIAALTSGSYLWTRAKKSPKTRGSPAWAWLKVMSAAVGDRCSRSVTAAAGRRESGRFRLARDTACGGEPTDKTQRESLPAQPPPGRGSRVPDMSAREVMGARWLVLRARGAHT